MTERIRIGTTGAPLRVLDSSGSSNELSNLFNSNFQVLRGPLLKGAIYCSYATLQTVYYGQTFSRAPLFFMMCNDGVFYNGVTLNQVPWNATSLERVASSGHLGRSYNDRLTLYSAIGSPYSSYMVTFYYAIMRNKVG